MVHRNLMRWSASRICLVVRAFLSEIDQVSGSKRIPINNTKLLLEMYYKHKRVTLLLARY